MKPFFAIVVLLSITANVVMAFLLSGCSTTKPERVVVHVESSEQLCKIADRLCVNVKGLDNSADIAVAIRSAINEAERERTPEVISQKSLEAAKAVMSHKDALLLQRHMDFISSIQDKRVLVFPRIKNVEKKDEGR